MPSRSARPARGLGEVEESADLIRYYSQTARDNAFFDHPWTTAATRPRTPARSSAARRVCRHQPFNFRWRSRPADGGGAHGRQRGRLQARQRRAMSGTLLVEACRDAGVPTASSTSSWDRGHGGRRADEEPDIDGIVFTGSYDVGFSLFRSFSSRYARPCIVEMGARTRPSSCAAPTWTRRPRASCARLRLRRPEVLGQQPRLRRAQRPRRARAAARGAYGAHQRGRSASARDVAGAGHRRPRRGALRSRGGRGTPRRQVYAAASTSATARWPAASTWSPPWWRAAGRPPAVRRRAVLPFTAVHAVDSLTRPWPSRTTRSTA